MKLSNTQLSLLTNKIVREIENKRNRKITSKEDFKQYKAATEKMLIASREKVEKLEERIKNMESNIKMEKESIFSILGIKNAYINNNKIYNSKSIPEYFYIDLFLKSKNIETELINSARIQEDIIVSENQQLSELAKKIIETYV